MNNNTPVAIFKNFHLCTFMQSWHRPTYRASPAHQRNWQIPHTCPPRTHLQEPWRVQGLQHGDHKGLGSNQPPSYRRNQGGKNRVQVKKIRDNGLLHSLACVCVCVCRGKLIQPLWIHLADLSLISHHLGSAHVYIFVVCVCAAVHTIAAWLCVCVCALSSCLSLYVATCSSHDTSQPGSRQLPIVALPWCSCQSVRSANDSDTSKDPPDQRDGIGDSDWSDHVCCDWMVSFVQPLN